MEHRRFTRVPFNVEVRIDEPQTQQSWNSELIDISLKGLKLSRPHKWKETEHSHFKITLLLARHDTEITIQATLKHHDDAVLGFQTIHIDVDSASHLHRLLELNLGDSKLLDREYHELISPELS